MISDIACGVGTFITTYAVTEAMSSQPWWVNVITAVISAIIFGGISIGTKILTSFLEKKGIISTEHKKSIDNAADDLADDGKINGSR